MKNALRIFIRVLIISAVVLVVTATKVQEQSAFYAHRFTVGIEDKAFCSCPCAFSTNGRKNTHGQSNHLF